MTCVRRSILSIVFLCVLTSCTKAQILYKIYGNGAATTSYLFATNPLTDISFLDSVPSLFKCYSQTDKVITEFAMQDYEALAALRTAALLSDSVQLHQYYTEDEYNEINESIILTLGMGLDKLGRMKPQYLTEMYRIELLRKWAGYDENRSSSHFFEAVAQQQKKPIYGLDDIGETMFMTFDRETFQWQCKELLEIIRYPERDVRQAKMLKELYQQGRLLDIAYLVSGPDNESSISFSDYQIYAKRNQQWAKRLKGYLMDGKAFINLDAIYLGGENGLIAELRAAGWTVKPVNRRYSTPTK